MIRYRAHTHTQEPAITNHTMSTTPEKTFPTQTPLEVADAMMTAAGIEVREIRYSNDQHPSKQFSGKTTEERMVKLAAEITDLREQYKEVAQKDAHRSGIIANYIQELTEKLVELKKKEYNADTQVFMAGNGTWARC